MTSSPFLYNAILITNDDGIDAPGLKILHEIASEIAKEVWVVAPEQDQSGKAQSITIHQPLRVIQKQPNYFAVNGTPADCVVMGVKEIMPFQPDLILSGVNRGSNLGMETIFSGTVGAAMTGSLLGIPSLALSQNFIDGQDIPWDTARYHGVKILKKIFEKEWVAEKNCLNINFPACHHTEVQSIEFTRQGTGYIEDIHPVKRQDIYGKTYYWLNFVRPLKKDIMGTETEAINNRNISITPLSYERTNEALLNLLKS